MPSLTTTRWGLETGTRWRPLTRWLSTSSSPVRQSKKKSLKSSKEKNLIGTTLSSCSFQSPQMKNLLGEEVDLFCSFPFWKIKFLSRSSLLYPPAFELKTSEAELLYLSGVFRKSERKNINFRPVYINSANSEYMFYQGIVFHQLIVVSVFH